MANALFVVLVILAGVILSDLLLAGVLALMDVADPARLRAMLTEGIARVRRG